MDRGLEAWKRIAFSNYLQPNLPTHAAHLEMNRPRILVRTEGLLEDRESHDIYRTRVAQDLPESKDSKCMHRANEHAARTDVFRAEIRTHLLVIDHSLTLRAVGHGHPTLKSPHVPQSLQ